MNFSKWGQEYLQEASELKVRIDALREQLKTAKSSELCDLNRRIYMLYSMYLECKHIGMQLQSYDADPAVAPKSRKVQ